MAQKRPKTTDQVFDWELGLIFNRFLTLYFGVELFLAEAVGFASGSKVCQQINDCACRMSDGSGVIDLHPLDGGWKPA